MALTLAVHAHQDTIYILIVPAGYGANVGSCSACSVTNCDICITNYAICDSYREFKANHFEEYYTVSKVYPEFQIETSYDILKTIDSADYPVFTFQHLSDYVRTTRNVATMQTILTSYGYVIAQKDTINYSPYSVTKYHYQIIVDKILEGFTFNDLLNLKYQYIDPNSLYPKRLEFNLLLISYHLL